MSPEDGAEVTRLVEERDPRIMAAYDLYYEEQDVEELMDTIRATAKFCHSQRYARERRRDGESNGNKGPDVRRIVEECYSRGELSEEEAATLVSSNDPRLLATIDTFASDGDWEDMCDTLRRLSAHLMPARDSHGGEDWEKDDEMEEEEQEVAQANGYKYSYDTEAGTTDYTSGVTDEDEEEVENFTLWRQPSANNDDANGGMEEEEVVVDVGDLILNLNLELDEKMIIYDLIREEDAEVYAAFEQYDDDQDTDQLKDTLVQIIQDLLDGEEEDGGEDSVDQGNRLYSTEVAENVFGSLFDNGVIQEEERERFIMLLNGGNIIANAALEVFGVNGDAEDFVDTMRRIQ